VEFATLLVPSGPLTQHPGLLQTFEGKYSGAEVRTYVWSQASGETYFFFAEQPGSWRIGPWASDAQFVFFSDGYRQKSQAVHSLQRELSGVLWPTPLYFKRCDCAVGEWLSQADGHQFSCSNESAVTFQPSMLTVQHC